MSKLLEDCWAKLDWAKKHADLLDDELRLWLKSEAHNEALDIAHEFNYQEGCFIFKTVKLQELPVRWSLIAADAINNFRTSLDYLAWLLVGKGTNPSPKRPNQVYFPIHSKREDFNGAVDNRLPGVLPEHLTVVEAHQPYLRGNDAHLHPLAVLADLSRKDKHHKIQLTYVRMANFRCAITDAENFAPTRMVVPTDTNPFRLNTEFMRIFGTHTGPGRPGVRMKFEFTGSVAFENERWIWDVMDEIGAEVLSILSEIEPLL